MMKTKKWVIALLLASATMIMAGTGIKYSVTKKGSSLVVVFKQPTTIRIHTTPNYAPYMEKTISSNRYSVRVDRGQWLEGKSNGRWVYLNDADNR